MASSNVTVYWVRGGAYGMTPTGWTITRRPLGLGFMVFDDQDQYVGTYATRREAEEAAR